MQVAGSGMRIERTKACKKNFLHIGFIIAVGILQKQHMWCLRDVQTTVGKHHSSWDTEALSKIGELIGLAIFIGILADNDVIRTTFRLALVRVIFGNQYEQSTAFVPAHGNRVHHVRLMGKQFERKVDGHLNMLH